jgi:hypothetical protein
VVIIVLGLMAMMRMMAMVMMMMPVMRIRPLFVFPFVVRSPSSSFLSSVNLALCSHAGTPGGLM